MAHTVHRRISLILLIAAGLMLLALPGFEPGFARTESTTPPTEVPVASGMTYNGVATGKPISIGGTLRMTISPPESWLIFSAADRRHYLIKRAYQESMDDQAGFHLRISKIERNTDTSPKIVVLDQIKALKGSLPKDPDIQDLDVQNGFHQIRMASGETMQLITSRYRKGPLAMRQVDAVGFGDYTKVHVSFAAPAGEAFDQTWPQVEKSLMSLRTPGGKLVSRFGGVETALVLPILIGLMVLFALYLLYWWWSRARPSRRRYFRQVADDSPEGEAAATAYGEDPFSIDRWVGTPPEISIPKAEYALPKIDGMASAAELIKDRKSNAAAEKAAKKKADEARKIEAKKTAETKKAEAKKAAEADKAAAAKAKKAKEAEAKKAAEAKKKQDTKEADQEKAEPAKALSQEEKVAALQDKWKGGFFSRLFGRKKTVKVTPEAKQQAKEAQVVHKAQEQKPDVKAAKKDEQPAIIVVDGKTSENPPEPKAEIKQDSPKTEAKKAQKKPGFFARLFGRKPKADKAKGKADAPSHEGKGVGFDIHKPLDPELLKAHEKSQKASKGINPTMLLSESANEAGKAVTVDANKKGADLDVEIPTQSPATKKDVTILTEDMARAAKEEKQPVKKQPPTVESVFIPDADNDALADDALPIVEEVMEKAGEPVKKTPKRPLRRARATAAKTTRAKASAPNAAASAAEVKPEPKVEAKPEPKVEAKPEPKVEAKAEPKVETKPEPTVEAKAEAKAEPKVEAKADVKPEPQGRQGASAAKTQKAPVAKAAAEAVAKQTEKVEESYLTLSPSERTELTLLLDQIRGNLARVDAILAQAETKSQEQEERIARAIAREDDASS